MTYKNKNLEMLIAQGWTPTYHGEFLDLYNKRSQGGASSTILTGISSRNMHYVVEEKCSVLCMQRFHRCPNNEKIMIAKIYPDNHPDLQGKKDPKHPVRYFDIRKLTPPECYRLMGVPERQISQLMATEQKPYTAFVDVDKELEVFGLEPSATMKEVEEAFRDSLESLETPPSDEDNEAPADAPDTVPSDSVAGDEEDDDAEEIELLRQNYTLAYEKIKAAKTEERFGPVQIISNSNHYKLAGNSIVCDVLMYIYEAFLFPTDRRIPGEVQDMFALPPFHMSRNFHEQPLKVVTLCSGYDSQCIAFDMLRERYPDFAYELVAWAEFDPESKRALAEQPAVVAHNLLFPQWKDLNRGDMTKCDWSDLSDAGIDFLTYSTPCQSISQAGKREGIKKGSDTRSAVLWYTEKAVEQMRPKILLQENVSALINSVNMPDFKEWCALLQKHGYVNFLAPSFPYPWGKEKREKKTKFGILNSKHYGVAQNRERVYMLSIRQDILGDTQYEFPRPFELTTCIADILEDEVSEKFFLKPDSVIKFLSKNETDAAAKIYYTVTDHKLSDEEIAAIRAQG